MLAALRAIPEIERPRRSARTNSHGPEKYVRIFLGCANFSIENSFEIRGRLGLRFMWLLEIASRATFIYWDL